MAVNVSAIEFRAEKFLDGVFAALQASGLAPRLLELELTESVLMKHVDVSTPTLQRLRERGIRVAIDDFGTGYSSLSYLRRFHVDALKIDQSFVRQIDLGGDEMHIVAAVIGMAKNLNLRVVAEGVERAEELAFLRANHCDEAQGYYFSRPVPADQFAAFLKNGLLPDPTPLSEDTAIPQG
jgi:EAL domain-containing protein (putative c-di-GMP-specific phosphodiesterase class I)